MDDRKPEDERAVNALKRAVSHDLSFIAQLDYAKAPSSTVRPTNAFGKKRRAHRFIAAAGIAIFLGGGTYMSSRILFPAPKTLIGDYDSEVRMLIDEIHIDNPSRFELADIE